MWDTLKNAVERWPVAWLLAVALAVLPMVNWVGVALSLVIVLRHGPAIGFLPVMTTGATVFLAFHGFFSSHGFRFDLPVGTWLAMAMIFVPLWISAVVLRTMRSFALSVQLLFMLNFVWIWVGHLSWGELTVNQWYDFLINTMVATDLQDTIRASEDETNEYFKALAQALLYMWPAFIFFIQIIVTLLSRWMQSCMYYPGGFQQDFHQLRISQVLTALSVGGMLWAAFAPFNVLAEQWSSIGNILLSLAGLAWIHWYVAFKKASRWWLIALYAVLFVIGGLLVPLLSLIGVCDSGLDLRNRLTKGKTTP